MSVAGNRAFSEIAGCVSNADTLLAVVAVDESSSLRSTDPHNMRVPAITSAIDALEELKASAPGRLNVEVSMSTFARSYHRLVGWGELNARHADRLRASATDELAQRNSGDATDYRQALKGAQRQLDTRADQLPGKNVCKVMLWFTDGALDVDSSTATAADQLCRQQGIVDAVRHDRISVVALALFTPGGGVTNAQRHQLQAVAEGTGQAARCGKTPIAPDASSGVYLSADHPAALRRLFAGATTLISGGTAGPTTQCPTTTCPQGRFGFDLDPGVGGFRVVADVGADGTGPTLVTPDGKRLKLPASGSKSFPVRGGSLQAFARNGLVTATMMMRSLPTAATHWQLDLGREGGGVDLYWYWGAKLTVQTPKLEAGSASQIRGSITGPDGQLLDPRLYSRLDVRTVVGPQTAAATVNPDGSFVAEVASPRNAGSSEAAIKVKATARTRGSDIDLGPLAFSATAPITLPPAFPTLSPTRLHLPALEGLGVRPAVIHLNGSRLGPTRVCFTRSTVSGPGDAQMDASVRRGDCVKLAAGQKSQLRVDLEPATAADGMASGDLTFDVTGADNAGTVKVSVPAEFDMTRQVDESTRWLLVLLLVGLALAIPALLLLLAEWLLARFTVTPTHQTAAVRVKLTKSGPERLDADHALLESRDLANLSLVRSQRFRRFHVSGSDAVLRVRRRWDFARGSHGVVTVPKGRLVASDKPPFSRRPGDKAEVEFGTADLWFVVTDPATVRDSETPEAKLVVLFPMAEVPLSDRAAQIRRAPWESILAALRGHAEAAEQQPPPRSPGTPATTIPPSDPDAMPSWMQPTGDARSSNSPGDLPSWLSRDETESQPPQQPVAASRRIQRPRRGGPTAPTESPSNDLPPMDFLK